MPKRNRAAFRSRIKTRFGGVSGNIINNLAGSFLWTATCLLKGMTLTLIVIALQALAMLVTAVRESGNDARFEGDKLTFRS